MKRGIRGRRGRDVMAEFAEHVMLIPLRGDLADSRRAKINLEPRFMDGVFLGLTDRSDEIIVYCVCLVCFTKSQNAGEKKAPPNIHCPL